MPYPYAVSSTVDEQTSKRIATAVTAKGGLFLEVCSAGSSRLSSICIFPQPVFETLNKRMSNKLCLRVLIVLSKTAFHLAEVLQCKSVSTFNLVRSSSMGLKTYNIPPHGTFIHGQFWKLGTNCYRTSLCLSLWIFFIKNNL